MQYSFLKPQDAVELEDLVTITLTLARLYFPKDFPIFREIVQITIIERSVDPGLLLEVARRLGIPYGAVRKKVSARRESLLALVASFYSADWPEGDTDGNILKKRLRKQSDI